MRVSLRFRPILGWALAALFAWACGESGDGPGSSGGGAGSSAGAEVTAGGEPGSQGDAGSPGDPCVAAPDSEACREVPWCGPFGLQEVCGPTPFPLCPTSFADWVERNACDTVSKLEAYDTTCGGRVLALYYEGKTETWEFDADETLLSVMREGASLHVCYEGGRSTKWLFGAEPCAAEPGTTVDVCLAGGAGSGGAGGAGLGELNGGAGNAATSGAGGAR